MTGGYSSYLDTIHKHSRVNTSLREIQNHMTTMPSLALRTFSMDEKEHVKLWRPYANRGQGCTNYFMFSHAENRISILITSYSVILQINERFPVMNNFEVLFSMLFSCRDAYVNLDFEGLLVHATIKFSKTWIMQLFNQGKKGVYQV